MHAKTILLAAALMTSASAAAGPADGHDLRDLRAPALAHFALSRSAPAADSSVPAPPEIRLWFTEVPQENSMSVRLVDGAGQPVEAGALGQEADDGRVFHLPLEATLPAGGYTVAWRAIGADGHVVRGDFGFTVTAQ